MNIQTVMCKYYNVNVNHTNGLISVLSVDVQIYWDVFLREWKVSVFPRVTISGLLSSHFIHVISFTVTLAC